MSRPPPTQPTDVELQILRVLWDAGGATARELHNALCVSKETNYSTTVKMLAVMLDKGLVERDESVRPQIYRAADSQESTQQHMLGEFINKLYGGSATSLVMQALAVQPASTNDLAEIRQLLDDMAQDTSRDANPRQPREARTSRKN